jgi:FKBP-type peptidyl-prolyl cis-trans isomerase FklB
MNAAVGLRNAMSPVERCHGQLPTLTAIAAAVFLASAAQAQSPPSPGTAAKPAAAPPATAQAGSAAAPEGKKAAGAKAPSKEGSANMKTPAPANSKSQGSYSLGVSMGDQLHRAGLTSDSVAVERVAQGLRDALSGKAKMTQDDQEHIATLVRAVRATAGESNHAAARAFLAENGKKKDVVTTASGLQYKVLTPGDGASPKPTDQVTVNYRGTLLDGTEFDSSYKRGQPATFPVNGVIPAWQEALVLMKPGAKWQLFVPPSLAYDLDSPPSIPPGSMLVFDVELLRVKAPAAQPQQAPSQPQVQPQQQPPK